MNLRKGHVVWLSLGLVTPALAQTKGDRFGTVEQAQPCEKEYSESKAGSWGGNVHQKPTLILKAIADGKVSAECKVEVDRRVQVYATDKGINYGLNDRLKSGNYGKDAKDYYTISAVFGVFDVLLNVEKDKEKEEARKKAEEEAKKKEAEMIAQTELPKPDKRDPALEKAIGGAYKAAFPDNKVLKVILRSDDWSIERSSIGIITGRTMDATIAFQKNDGSCGLHHEGWWQGHDGKKFSKTLEQRGEGSMQLEGILCEKVK